MAAIIYYLPGVKSGAHANRLAAGLGYLGEGPDPASADTQRGPDGGAGCYCVFPRSDGQTPPLHIPEKAQWFAILGARAQFTFDPADPPGPDDLARKDLLDGYPVVLSDGKSWTVCAVRRLPRRLVLANGEWTTGEVVPRYKDLFERMLPLWNLFIGVTRPEEAMSVNVEIETAILGLAVNYRLGSAEVSALGLLDTQSEVRLARALLDFPFFEEALKKKAADGSSSRPGDADSSPTTDPPGPS